LRAFVGITPSNYTATERQRRLTLANPLSPQGLPCVSKEAYMALKEWFIRAALQGFSKHLVFKEQIYDTQIVTIKCLINP